jgi:diaminopimelate epimerase
MPVRVIKAHAYGNDFVCLEDPGAGADLSGLARAICDRHRGIGADGLVAYATGEGRVSMRLVNADGSPSELSGNGLRCLGALVAHAAGHEAGAVITVETGAGIRTLELLGRDGASWTFRTAMGPPGGLSEADIDVAGERIRASVLSMGNPQCVVLGPLPDEERFRRLGRALAVHPRFPAGTNVEFAEVERPDRVRILIWERGVGPTESSGTGSSAAAVAAAAHGGASRTLDVVAPGGTQHVEWREDGVYLTGAATLVMDGEWLEGPGR